MVDSKDNTQQAPLPDPRESLGERLTVPIPAIQREFDWGTERIIDSLTRGHSVGSFRGRG